MEKDERKKIEELTKEVIKENEDLIKAFEIYDKTGKITEGLKVIKTGDIC